jgi:hypothetical protein
MQRSIHAAIHERVVAQQELERQNFRVRGSGGECCISECLMSPAQGSLSGEWEVPVTRNAEIDPGDNDPPA